MSIPLINPLPYISKTPIMTKHLKQQHPTHLQANAIPQQENDLDLTGNDSKIPLTF